MNNHEAQRIAAGIHALRPDWPAKQLETLIGAHLADRPRRDVAVALAWVACESDTANPYRVLEAGPWWRATGGWQDDQRAPRPPKPSEACQVCGRHATRCICETAPQVRPTPTGDHETGIARLRAELTTATATHCPCGVNRDRCTEHRGETAVRAAQTHDGPDTHALRESPSDRPADPASATDGGA